MDPKITPSERNQLVQRYWQATDNVSWPKIGELNEDEAKEAYAVQDRIAAEYAERLPFVRVSRCPFCEKPLECAMDNLGFDGPWWMKGPIVEYPEPDACEHFATLLGAIDFKGKVPLLPARLGEVLPGPAVPFAVPYMLEIPIMRAVVSKLAFPEGQIGYPIAYFSEDVLHGAFLHQPWGREAYEVKDEDGEHVGWTQKRHAWDFDLRPWIDLGRFLWIEANDPAFRLVGSGECSYENLPGAQQPQLIRNGRIELMDPPDDKTAAPFD